MQNLNKTKITKGLTLAVVTLYGFYVMTLKDLTLEFMAGFAILGFVWWLLAAVLFSWMVGEFVGRRLMAPFIVFLVFNKYGEYRLAKWFKK